MNTQNTNQKQFNLEDRTLLFAKNCRDFVLLLPKNPANIEYASQLIRSSGSVGANYIEANDSLSKKDFSMRIKISKKEAKETCFWLQLVTAPESLEVRRKELLDEATQLMKIFGAILIKSQT